MTDFQLPDGVRRVVRLARLRRTARDAARDVDDEIAFHLAMREASLRATGLSDDDARAAARRRFGDVRRVADACRVEDSTHERARVRTDLVTAFVRDVRLALRAVRRAPLVAAAAWLTLAVGIGATAAVFSIAYDAVLRPLPVERPDRLVFLWGRVPARGDERLPVAAPDVAAIEARSRSFAAVAFTNRVSDGTWIHDGEADRLRVAAVTANYFATLGAGTALGRFFRAGEDEIVLSDALWRTRFGADSAVLGSRLTIDGRSLLVVGVMPHGFAVPFPPGSGFAAVVDGWTPLQQELARFRRDGALIDQDSDNAGAVIARLRDGATPASAERELAQLADELRRDTPGRRSAETDGARIVVAPLAADGVRHLRPALTALLVAAVLLYLVACLNVASVIFAGVLARAREFGVRSALGAGRARIARQVLAEVVVHATIGLVGGVALALAADRLAARVRPTLLPRVDDGAPIWPMLAVALGTATVAVLVVGLAASRRAAVLGDSRAATVRGAGVGDAPGDRWRRPLTTAQIALAVLLAVGCGLVMRSAARLVALDPGFRAEGTLAFDLSLRGDPRYTGPAGRAAALAAVERALRDVPGVVAAGVVGRLPLGERRWTNAFSIDGDRALASSETPADFRMVSPDYFQAIGTRLMRGRSFMANENLVEAHRVVIVDEVLAHRIAQGADALGRRLTFPLDGKRVSAEVVGIVAPVRFASLWEPPRGAFYVPYRHEASRDVSVVVRTTGDVGALAEAVRPLVRAVDPRLPVYNVRPMSAYVDDALAGVRLALAVLGWFAGGAIALALFGVFATLSHAVARRRREIGVRLALGATPARVTGDVLRVGGTVVAGGAAIGVALALVAGRALQALLFEVGPSDPLVLGAVAVAVVLAGLGAAVVPARRAARTDPMSSIRTD